MLDRLVGYKISPLLWRAGPPRPVGRPRPVRRGPADRRARARDPGVQAGRVLDHRRPAHAGGRPAAVHGPACPDPRGQARGQPDKKGIALHAEPGAHGHAQKRCRGRGYRVTKVERKERKRSPSPPFTTSTLQQEAARKLGFGARKTMTLAQRLYEGVNIPGEGTVGLITYMRTDSVNIADTALREVAEVVRTEFGDEYTLAEPRRYKTRSRNAQEAHEAIRPTSVLRSPRPRRVGRRSRPAPALHDDLAAHRGEPDGRGALQPGGRRHRGGRRRTVPRTACVPPARRSCSTGSSASTRRVATTTPDEDAESRLPELTAEQLLRTPRRPARAALHAAAAPLHRGLAREDARGARDRAAVHLRLDHLDDPGPRVRAPGGQALLSRGRGRGGHRQAGRALRGDRGRQLHRPHGRGARPDRRRRGPADRRAARVLGTLQRGSRARRGEVRALRRGARRGVPEVHRGGPHAPGASADPPRSLRPVHRLHPLRRGRRRLQVHPQPRRSGAPRARDPRREVPRLRAAPAAEGGPVRAVRRVAPGTPTAATSSASRRSLPASPARSASRARSWRNARASA